MRTPGARGGGGWGWCCDQPPKGGWGWVGCPVLGLRPRPGRGERRQNFACGGRKFTETLSPFFLHKNCGAARGASPITRRRCRRCPGQGTARQAGPASPSGPGHPPESRATGGGPRSQPRSGPPTPCSSPVNAILVSEMRFVGRSTHAISACWGWGGAGGGGGWGGAPPSRRQRGLGWVGVPAALCGQLPHRPSQGNTTQALWLRGWGCCRAAHKQPA